ncbi:MAG TPA: UDP-N-acetylmuramate--L-alanine ligase [Cyclobacteriaceae bacterium]|nr:UDP-N-acetylmuramate--L-alanine ligase [Cyclobacteriaceae bacterium]
MDTWQYHNVYFLGIGGIGMSALARWFHRKGVSVSGYDRTQTKLTDELASEGMHVHYVDSVENIPGEVKDDKAGTLIVYTPAIPKDHQELNYLRNEGYTLMKRSEVLGLITKGHTTIAVAGTHGKTTTSSLIAHILRQAGKNMVAFLGGVTANYESNLVMHGEAGENTIVVAEADEFDRSFLRLFPRIAVVTSADPDHLDIYGDHDQLVGSFKDFIRQINEGGDLVIHETIADRLAGDTDRVNKHTYSLTRGQFFASNVTARSGFFEFDLHGFATVEKIVLGVPGFHNVENAIAASVAVSLCGVEMHSIREALKSFKGVKRRFEFIVKTSKVIFIDDYAHHPAEIEAFLGSVRTMYPERRLTAVFQPHLYTRTRDFAEGFSRSLSIADELILMDIYPARELPIPGVDSDMLMKDVTSEVKIRCSKEDLMNVLEQRDFSLIVTIGAGDIDTFVEPIRTMLERKYEEI